MKQDSLQSGAVYHIYNRGNNQENIFIDHGNYFYFLQLMKKYLVPVSDIFAYCLLKNHFHLLLRIKDKQELEGKLKEKPHLAFSNFFNAYTKSINKKYNRTGSLFQEHLKRKRVENTNYLIQLIAYIHLNPIKQILPTTLKHIAFPRIKVMFREPLAHWIEITFLISSVQNNSNTGIISKEMKCWESMSFLVVWNKPTRS